MSKNNEKIDKSDYKTFQKPTIEKNSKTVLNVINKQHSKEKNEEKNEDIER